MLTNKFEVEEYYNGEYEIVKLIEDIELQDNSISNYKKEINISSKHISKKKYSLKTYLYASVAILLHKYTDQQKFIINFYNESESKVSIINLFEGKKTVNEYIDELNEALLLMERNRLEFAEFCMSNNLYKDTISLGIFKDDIRIEKDKASHRMQNSLEILIKISENDSINNIIVEIRYKKIYLEDTIQRFVERLNLLILSLLKDTDLFVDDLSIMLDQEEKIISEFNNEYIKLNEESFDLVSIFKKIVYKYPNKIAVLQGSEKNTFKEIDIKSDMLAKLLIKNGVECNDIVGIYMTRSIGSIISILAIIKSGAAYLAIDIDYPINRINFMIKDSGINVILVDENSKLRGIDKSIKLINYKDGILNDDKKDSISYKRGELAYVIYTSGSTGTPKGVAVGRNSISNLINLIRTSFNIDSNDTFSQSTSMSFDASVFEIFGSIFNGASLNIFSKSEVVNYFKLQSKIKNEHITVVFLPPTYLNYIDIENFSNTKYLITGGSALSKKVYDQIKNKVNYVNIYGPTETTVFCTYWIGKSDLKERTLPIGKPVTNSKTYILDKNNRLQPIGIPGELVVAGQTLAVGYIKDIRAKKENKFFSEYNGEKIYRTGDIARWKSDGNIEYLGRKDNQIKINGFRVELGEIDYYLRKHNKVKDVAIVISDKECSRIDSYVIVKDNDINSNTLYKYLSNNIPEYLIPSKIKIVEEIPLNTSGKIDINRLKNM